MSTQELEISPDQAMDTFAAATEENQTSSFREQQVLLLPGEGEVWLVGDLHDHRRNFEKTIKAADLANNPQRHLILQELIHAEHYDESGAEESWLMLYKAAALKVDFSSQVHFLLANHDLAQIHGKGIMKGSTSVCEAFNKGVKKAFRDRAGRIQVAITEFLL